MTYGAGNSGDYKRLKGQMIQVTDTDPTVNLGSWATGGNLNTAREFLNSAGTCSILLVIYISVYSQSSAPFFHS